MSKFGSGLYRLEVKAAGRKGREGRAGQDRAGLKKEGKGGQGRLVQYLRDLLLTSFFLHVGHSLLPDLKRALVFTILICSVARTNVMHLI